MHLRTKPRTPKNGLWTATVLGLSLGALCAAACIRIPIAEEAEVHLVEMPTMIAVEVEAAPESLPPVTPVPAPSPTPTPEPSPTPTPSRHPMNGDALLPGDDEPIVLDIELRLMELEYLDFEQPDSEYSDGTAEAIKAFQLRNGLNANGICDKATYEALFDGHAKTYAMVLGSSGEGVEVVKERLIELGYLDGLPIGSYDEETEAAVKRFRLKNRLTEDVIIDNAAFEVLLGEDTVSNFFGIGEQSEEILKCQEQLYSLGYLTYQPDGIFGKQTQNAVRRFQEQNGLVIDGCLGKSTIELLNSGKADSFCFTVGMEGADVQRIQERLAHYGYLTDGQVTGFYGEKTKSAVNAFQSRNKLKTDGVVGAQTMAALNSDTATKAKPTATPRPTAKTTPKPTAKTTPKPGTTATTKPTATPKPDDGDSGTQTGSTINYGQGVEAFIKIAESKLGCKYVRGAKGPNTFDCSGFVYWCLNQAGVKQSYMTSIAWRKCTKYLRITNMKDIKRGDVLVFKGKSMSTGHVGIYLGNGKMIDASSTKGKVRITDSIQSSTYWKEHFLMAYRIWD